MPVMKAFRKDKEPYGCDRELTEVQLGKCLLLGIVIRGSMDSPGKCYILRKWDDNKHYTYDAEAACSPGDKRMRHGRMYFDTPQEAIDWWVTHEGK